MKMSNEYTCAICKETFVNGWTVEEALAESKALFGDIPVSELSNVCDDCFKVEMKKRGSN
jgi:hypothetical protein